jgi:hypothetical protein
MWGVAFRWSEVTGGDNGLPDIKRPDLFGLNLVEPGLFYGVMIALFVIALVGMWIFTQSGLGLSLQGTQAVLAEVYPMDHALEQAMDRIEGLWPEDLGEYAKRILTLPVMLTQGGQQFITLLVYEALPATVSAAPQLAVSDWLAWFEGKGMQHPDTEFQLNTAQNRK